MNKTDFFRVYIHADENPMMFLMNDGWYHIGNSPIRIKYVGFDLENYDVNWFEGNTSYKVEINTNTDEYIPIHNTGELVADFIIYNETGRGDDVLFLGKVYSTPDTKPYMKLSYETEEEESVAVATLSSLEHWEM